MKPVKFKEQNCIYAEHQPEYQPLPAYKDGIQVISCWQLTWLERFKIFFTGVLWLRQMNFGSALQPQLPQLKTPFIKNAV